MSEEQVLKRRLSPVNVWALALGCIIGWGAFVMPGNTFLVNAGPAGTGIAMGIAAVVLIVVALNYSHMIRRYPIAGGEFVYAQKTFGRTHGFICAWFLSLSYLAIVPLNATALALIGRNLMGGIFQTGFHYTVAGYDIYMGEILLAAAALVLFALLSIRGVKTAGLFQTVLVFALVLGVLAVSCAAFAEPSRITTALDRPFNPDVGPIAGILAVVAVAPWAFVGFDTIPQAAEEFDFPPGKTKGIMILSIAFGAAVYAILTIVTASVVPEGYTSWVDYIAASSFLDGLEALPTFNAAYTLLGAPGLVLLTMAVCAAILSGIIGFYMAASRLLYSLAREEVIPTAFGRLHPKYRTPYVAILFVMAIALFAPFFGRTALGWIVDMSSLGAAIGYGYTSLAALKTAWAERDTPVIFTGALGAIFAAVFAFLLLVPVPGLDCSLGAESYVCLAIWIVLGAVFYVRGRRKGVQAAKEETKTA